MLPGRFGFLSRVCTWINKLFYGGAETKTKKKRIFRFQGNDLRNLTCPEFHYPLLPNIESRKKLFVLLAYQIDMPRGTKGARMIVTFTHSWSCGSTLEKMIWKALKSEAFTNDSQALAHKAEFQLRTQAMTKTMSLDDTDLLLHYSCSVWIQRALFIFLVKGQPESSQVSCLKFKCQSLINISVPRCSHSPFVLSVWIYFIYFM